MLSIHNFSQTGSYFWDRASVPHSTVIPNNFILRSSLTENLFQVPPEHSFSLQKSWIFSLFTFIFSFYHPVHRSFLPWGHHYGELYSTGANLWPRAMAAQGFHTSCCTSALITSGASCLLTSSLMRTDIGGCWQWQRLKVEPGSSVKILEEWIEYFSSLQTPAVAMKQGGWPSLTPHRWTRCGTGGELLILLYQLSYGASYVDSNKSPLFLSFFSKLEISSMATFPQHIWGGNTL